MARKLLSPKNQFFDFLKVFEAIPGNIRPPASKFSTEEHLRGVASRYKQMNTALESTVLLLKKNEKRMREEIGSLKSLAQGLQEKLTR